MRLIFMGTPSFAVPTLQALLNSAHDVVAVYTAPPRPAHRGKKLNHSPVHEVAEAHNIPVFTPASLKSTEEHALFTAHQADIAVVVAYGLLLPQAILEAPKQGCLNIHPSDLPRWRGAAPIARSLMAGDTHTAICIMQMDAGLDTGAIWTREMLDVPDGITTPTWEQQLAEKSATLLLHTLSMIEEGNHSPTPQGQEGICYAHKLHKQEYALTFDKAAKEVLHHLHGVSPYGYVLLHGERIRLLHADIVQGVEGAHTGSILNDSMDIKCADGMAIHPLILQREGKKAMPAEECLRGLLNYIGEQV